MEELDTKDILDAVAKAGGLAKALKDDPFEKEFAKLRAYEQLLLDTSKIIGYGFASGAVLNDICFGVDIRVRLAKDRLEAETEELESLYRGGYRMDQREAVRANQAKVKKNRVLISALEDCLEWSATTQPKEEKS